MKRRQIILITAILVACVSNDNLWARPIVALEAEMAVTSWLRVDSSPLDSVLGREVKSVETFTNDDGEPLYHIVYLEPRGFVIVAANDRVEPIIGFADDGIYDPSCDDPLGALVTNDIKARMAKLRNPMVLSVQYAAGPAIRAQKKWIDLLSLSQIITDQERVMAVSDSDLDYLSEVRVDPLVRGIWAQKNACGQYCNNYYTPYHYPCGCVALSMAQIMHYHRHPSEGIGCLEFNVYAGSELQYLFTRGGDGNGGPYKWGLMSNYLSCATSEEQCEAIGALCYDAGVSVHMAYGPEQSVSGGGFAIRALRNTFGYETIARTRIIEHFRDAVNPNLDAGLPVIISLPGHQLVCDGYGYSASTLYHHLNMGHKGKDDAWYNIYDMKVPIQSGGYVDALRDILYNIMPSGDGEIISGRVTDSTDCAVPWATVIAEGTGGPYLATTNAKGIYALVHVQSETDYVVNVQKQGYTFSARNVRTGESADETEPGNRWGIDFIGFRGGDVEVDFETGDFAGFQWEHDGDASWVVVGDAAYSGSYSAQAGSIGDGEQSVLRLTLNCNVGQIAFACKTSSESSYDCLRFYIDGVEVNEWSGECDWTNISFPVDAGMRTFEWIYAKDGSVSDGSDTTWIDNITLPVSGSSLVVIDDFEAYDDNVARIWDAWSDGRDNHQNGAIIGYYGPNHFWREHTTETAIVYDGRQAMPYFYDTSLGNTEATMRMNSLRDWARQDVGMLSLWFRGHLPPAGAFVYTGGPGNGYVMTAAGADIGNRADECCYAYKLLRGPGRIEVNIQRIENIHEWAKAGVMIRETLDAGSKFAGVFVTPGHGCIFQARTDADMDAMSDASVATSQQREMPGNAWLKLERDDNDNFWGYYSEVAPAHDAWEPMPWNPLYIPMTNEVYIGMATTSHDTYRTAQAIFTWPETYGDDDPAWTSRDIGIIRNIPAPMRVAIADSAGRSASVFHNDPRAVLADTWTEWTIDLREFANQGVDLIDVEAISIGFGTGEMTPQTGAAGLVFFDDLYLKRITDNRSSIVLQATPGPACIDLSWCQYDFELFAGFNLYRANEPNGVFTRLNTTVLSNGRDSYSDADVQPNTTYYYKCAVVTTGMTESDYSNMASAVQLEVNPPQIQHEPITSAEPGSSLTFWTEVTDESGVQSVSLFFRRIGQTEYQNRSMVLIYHNWYSVTLEGEWNEIPGLEYYIEAGDGLSIATSGSAIDPYQVNVKAYIGPGGNLLPNGGFEDSGMAPWRVSDWDGAAATGQVVTDDPIEGTYCLHIEVTALGGHYKTCRLMQEPFIFKAGKQYTLSAWLKCDQGTRDISFVAINNDDWTWYGQQVFTMTDTWTKFSTTTQIFTEDTGNILVAFQMGFEVGDFWIDDIKLIEEDSPTAEIVEFVDENLKQAVIDELGEIGIITAAPLPSEMLSLIHLNADGRGIIDVTGLEKATNLVWLNLEDNQINDLSELEGASFPGLETLILGQNQIGSIIIMNTMALPELRSLELRENKLDSLSGLEAIPTVIDLSASGNQIVDISALENLPGLTFLDLARNQIGSISALTGLTSLTHVNLRENNITDITSLAEAQSLGSLMMRGNNISDISVLADLTNLSALELQNNNISDISPLTSLVHLEQLNLLGNPLNEDAWTTYIPQIIENNPSVNIYQDTFIEPGSNILYNGGFENGKMAPWGMWSTNGCVASGDVVSEDSVEGNYCFHIKVTSPGPESWNCGMEQGPFVFQEGRQYTLSAWLKCSQGTQDIRFLTVHDGGPNSHDQVFTMTDIWSEYSMTTPVFSEDTSPMLVIFHLGLEAGEFWVDDIQLIED